MNEMEGGRSLYQPLDRVTSEIRLLNVILLEADTDKESLIEVEMRHVPLDTANRTYVALSYTWGDPKPSKSIRLNGHDIEIRENLYDFLLRFRECMTDQREGRDLFETVELSQFYKERYMFSKEDEVKYSEMGEPLYSGNMPIWIDALCMDQSNVAELNDNVPRMKDIYEKAQHVIIWLGNETETRKEAMVFLQTARMNYGQDRLALILGDVSGEAGESDSQALGGFSRLGPAANLDEWEAVAQLFDHPYWKRMWVVQELAYSFLVARIWCGRHQMHAHSLAKVQRAYFGDELGDTGIRDYTHPRYDQAEHIPPSLVRGGPWPVEIIRELADRPHQLAVSGARSTREIMSVIRTRKATVPHDMIYALYQLIVRDSEHTLIVDYGRTVAQVYCDYMEYELAVSKSLQIWQLLTEKKSKVEGLPSWAVDWTEQDERHQIIPIKSAVTPPGPADTQSTPGVTILNFAGMRAPELVPPAQDVNNAAGATVAAVSILDPGKKISATGFMIGTIDGGGGEYKCVQHPDDEDTSFWEDIDDVISLLRESPSSNAKKVLQVGSCLLFDDRVQYYNTEDESNVKFFADHLLDIVLAVRSASPVFGVHYQDAMNHLLMICLDESKVDRIPRMRKGLSQVYEEFKQKVKQNFWDRTWIRNKKFDALGIAPAAARKGDILFVPHGCPFVMVFHDESDGTFSVIGPCWLYGFMHGEAVKMHADGLIEEKEVVLV
jgi:Heterokaryon incompatibility protein (HET)